MLAGLVLLVAISLLALVATSSMILQHRMAGNFADGQQARQAVAEALVQGEAFVFELGNIDRISDCVSDCFLPPLASIIRQTTELPTNPEYKDASWWGSWANEAGVDPITGDRIGEVWGFGSEPPRFLIEEVYFDDTADPEAGSEAPPLDGIGYYRVLGRGVGNGPAAIVVSETIVARPWLSDAEFDLGGNSESGFCAPFESWYDCGRVAWRQRR